MNRSTILRFRQSQLSSSSYPFSPGNSATWIFVKNNMMHQPDPNSEMVYPAFATAGLSCYFFSVICMKKITILKVLVPLVCWLSSNGWITLGYEDTIPHSNLRQLWKAILPSKLPLRRARYLYVCAAVLLLPILNPASFLFLPLVFIPKAVLINCLHTTLHYIGCFSGTQSRKLLYSILKQFTGNSVW